VLTRVTQARRLLMIVGCMMSMGCSHAPARQQSEQMRLARQADINYQGGKFEAARKQYETLVQVNPKFATGFVRLGVIAYQQGDAAKARENFTMALSVDPRNTQASYNLAMLHLNDAASLLNTYMSVTPPTAQRDEVRLLLAELKRFGGK
jgi:Tfp pilus assembly protein PilF